MNIDLKEQAHGEIERIFPILLPQNAVRAGRTDCLCHTMLDTLLHNKLPYAMQGWGSGKTYAYLTACILLKKFYPSGPAGSQPVVVSTSSVALQGRHHRRVHPILIPHLFRKPYHPETHSGPWFARGRSGSSAMPRLAQRLEAVKGKNKNEEQRESVFSLQSNYDLDAVTGLSGFDRRQVCVPKVCEKTCRLRNSCRYHQYLKEARSAEIFVQICNHNYLLADAAHRLQELRPLLNDYRALVIDEAHKLPDAARQMYGQSLSAEISMNSALCLTKEKYILAAQNLREKFGR